MTKDELIESLAEKLKDVPGDFEIMLDAEGFTAVQGLDVDKSAGTITITGV